MHLNAFKYLVLDEDNNVTGTNDESVAEDLAKEGFAVIRIGVGNIPFEVALMDQDFEPIAIEVM